MKYFPIIIALLAAAACTERIDLLTHAQQSKLVVSANISAEPSRQTVWLSTTVPYFGGAEAQGITSAQVSINGVPLAPCDSAAGEFHTPPDFFVPEGNTATLRILYDLNGSGTPQEFTATETMPHRVRLDTLHLFKVGLDTGVYRPPFMIMVGITRSLEDECFSAEMFYGERSMTRSLGDFSTGSVSHRAGEEITMVLTSGGSTRDMGDGDTLRLAPFDTLHIRINSIPRSTLQFMESAREEMNGSDPMFSGPPANIPTNIEGDNAVGIFALHNPGNTRSVVLPMNVRTLNGTWLAQDGSGRRLAISEGTAALNGSLYFTNVEVNADIRGFWAATSAAVERFRMENYNEFVELSSDVAWQREQRWGF